MESPDIILNPLNHIRLTNFTTDLMSFLLTTEKDQSHLSTNGPRLLPLPVTSPRLGKRPKSLNFVSSKLLNVFQFPQPYVRSPEAGLRDHLTLRPTLPFRLLSIQLGIGYSGGDIFKMSVSRERLKGFLFTQMNGLISH